MALSATRERATTAGKTEKLRPHPMVERLISGGLAITLAVAAAARLYQWFVVRQSDPFYAQAPPHFDMYTYTAWGRAIAAGDWLSGRFTGGEPFFYGPVYSYFLATLFAVFGENYDAVHLIQGGVGLAVPACLYVLSRDLFGLRPALVTGLLAAGCAPLLFYEQTLLMEGLLVAFHAGLLLCIVRGERSPDKGWRWWTAAGLLAGLITLARSNFLLLIPWLAAGTCVAGWRCGSPETVFPARSWSRCRWNVAAFLLSTGVVLGASLSRNLSVSGQWVLTTSNGPMNLYIGNAPDAAGTLELPRSFLLLKEHYGSESAVPWAAELRKSLAREPFAPFRLFFRKLWIFWNSYDVADNVSYYLGQRYSLLVRWSPSAWLMLVPLGISGLWITRRSWRDLWPFYLYVAVFPASVAMVFVLGRYRLPVLLPLLLWSGVALVELVRMAQQSEWKRLSPHAGMCLAALFALAPFRSPAVHANAAGKGALVRINEYNNLAQGQLDAGRPVEFRRILEDAVRVYPEAPELVGKLSDAYLKENRPAEAIRLLSDYIARRGAAPAALLRLAEACARYGDRPQALAVLDQLLRQDPGNARARALRAEISGQ